PLTAGPSRPRRAAHAEATSTWSGGRHASAVLAPSKAGTGRGRAEPAANGLPSAASARWGGGRSTSTGSGQVLRGAGALGASGLVPEDLLEDAGERAVILAESREEVRAALGGGVRGVVLVDGSEERRPLGARQLWLLVSSQTSASSRSLGVLTRPLLRSAWANPMCPGGSRAWPSECRTKRSGVRVGVRGPGRDAQRVRGTAAESDGLTTARTQWAEKTCSGHASTNRPVR